VREKRKSIDLARQGFAARPALKRQREGALWTLYSRHASSILNLAVHSLDRSAAEEMQDVFLSV
jgi:hypothetical protein